MRHAEVARLHRRALFPLISLTVGTCPTSSTIHHEVDSRTSELVSVFCLPSLFPFYLSLNKWSRYTNEDDSYIFVPAEPAGASPLVVHRNSGDIVLDCRFLYSQLTAYKYIFRTAPNSAVPSSAKRYKNTIYGIFGLISLSQCSSPPSILDFPPLLNATYSGISHCDHWSRATRTPSRTPHIPRYGFRHPPSPPRPFSCQTLSPSGNTSACARSLSFEQRSIFIQLCVRRHTTIASPIRG